MLRLSIGAKPAANAACAAVAARVFCGLMVDAPRQHNGAWISALFGALLAAPLLAAVRRLSGARKPAVGARILAGALALVLLGANLLDAAAMLSRALRSASFLALDRDAALAIIVPLGAAMLWCLSKNGDAVGYSAALWMRAFIALMLLIAIPQMKVYRPAWLRPVLGDGATSILRGALQTAGWIAGIGGVFMAVDPDEPSPAAPPMRFLAVSAAAATALILLRLMLAPTFRAGDGMSWLMRLDALLTNGRAQLYLQLPLIVAWYAALLHLIACEAFTASALLQRFAPWLDGRLCALAVLLPAAALAQSDGFEALYGGDFAVWVFGAVALTAALFGISTATGGRRACGA